MITKDKLQKLTIKGQKETEKNNAKAEIAAKKYDEELLKKLEQWLEYMITEIAKGGKHEAILPIGMSRNGRWPFKHLNAIEEVKKILNKFGFADSDYSIDSPTSECPLITIKW